MDLSDTDYRQRIRNFYDRLGPWEDRLGAYKSPAIIKLLEHGQFQKAHSVCELGCGTGRLAETLLTSYLPEDATYTAFELSERMLALSEYRLRRFGQRVKIDLTDGSLMLPADSLSADRFVATYVLDLLADDDIAEAIRDAYRILRPDGLLCIVSLTDGFSNFSRRVSEAWKWIAKRYPILLGGCRPVDVSTHLTENGFELRHRSVVSQFGVTSQVIVAGRK